MRMRARLTAASKPAKKKKHIILQRCFAAQDQMDVVVKTSVILNLVQDLNKDSETSSE